MPIQENIIKKTRKLKTCFEVVDLFCGVGGLSYGLKTAGFHILAGYDLDWTCQYAYETNTGGKFYYRDVSTIDGNISKGRAIMSCDILQFRFVVLGKNPCHCATIIGSNSEQ